MKQAKSWYLALIALGVVLLLVIILGVFAGGREPSQTRTDQLPGISMGGQTSVVGQIVKADPGTYTVEVLEGKDYDQRTGRFVRGKRGGGGDETGLVIVAGGEHDLVVGAIVQFEGIKSGNDSLELNRIIILTDTVKGPPPAP